MADKNRASFVKTPGLSENEKGKVPLVDKEPGRPPDPRGVHGQAAYDEDDCGGPVTITSR